MILQAAEILPTAVDRQIEIDGPATIGPKIAPRSIPHAIAAEKFDVGVCVFRVCVCCGCVGVVCVGVRVVARFPRFGCKVGCMAWVTTGRILSPAAGTQPDRQASLVRGRVAHLHLHLPSHPSGLHPPTSTISHYKYPFSLASQVQVHTTPVSTPYWATMRLGGSLVIPDAIVG